MRDNSAGHKQRAISFDLGDLVMTHNATNTLCLADVQAALQRHANGDWGDVGEEDWNFNQQALKQGSRILSTYSDSNDRVFWILTEADRSSTCILLPTDY